MIIELHLCAPPGEARRRVLTALLNICKDDNRLIINAMMRSGFDVPETMEDLGLQYQPPSGGELQTPRQPFYSLLDLLENGTFSCGDAAAYEAAVKEEKYGQQTQCICVAQGDNEYHAIYVTAEGPVDPTENWLRRVAGVNGVAASGANRWVR